MPRSLTTTICLTLLLTLPMVAASCGDDDATPDDGLKGVGESCEDYTECREGLLCIGLVCRSTAPEDDASLDDAGDPVADGGQVGDPCSTTAECLAGLSCVASVCAAADDVGTDVPTDVTADAADVSHEPDVMPDIPEVDRPEVLTGGVTLFEAHVDTPFVAVNVGNAGAAFVEPTAEDLPIAVIDGCDVFNVTLEEPPPVFGYDAGTITVDTVPTVIVTPRFELDGSVTYGSDIPEDTPSVFDANEVITFTISGGQHVDAFSQSLTTPGEHTMTSPAVDDHIAGSDLSVTWTQSGSDADVLINVVPLNSSGNAVTGRSLNCDPGSDTGAFTISAAAINQVIAASPNGTRAAITVIKAKSVEVAQGADTFYVNATYAAGNLVQLQ